MTFFLRGFLKARILMSINWTSPKNLSVGLLLAGAFDIFFLLKVGIAFQIPLMLLQSQFEQIA